MELLIRGRCVGAESGGLDLREASESGESHIHAMPARTNSNDNDNGNGRMRVDARLHAGIWRAPMGRSIGLRQVHVSMRIE
jgi:hypothetical protein